MAVKFKKKAAETAANALSADELQEKVDRYVELGAELKVEQNLLKPMSDELSELKKYFLTVCEDAPDDKKVTLEGVEHILEVGMKGNSSKVVAEVDEVFDLLGEDTFKLVVSFGITDLKKYASKAQLDEIIITERTGARSVKVVK